MARLPAKPSFVDHIFKNEHIPAIHADAQVGLAQEVDDIRRYVDSKLVR